MINKKNVLNSQVISYLINRLVLSTFSHEPIIINIVICNPNQKREREREKVTLIKILDN
jgi:hypothetical protein